MGTKLEGEENRRDPLLKISDLELSFGGISVLRQVSLCAHRRAITSLIGPNGSGKTSLLNCVTGTYTASKGSVHLDGRLINGASVVKRARLGLGRTFQHPGLFEGLSVIENVVLGCHQHSHIGLIKGMLGVCSEQRSILARSEELLAFTGIEKYRDNAVTTLPYGVRKTLELARVFAMQPKILLLDEPMAGLTFPEKVQLTEVITRSIEALGLSVLMIDHDLKVILDVSDHVIVLDCGQKVAEGKPSEVAADKRVREVYSGSFAAA